MIPANRPAGSRRVAFNDVEAALEVTPLSATALYAKITGREPSAKTKADRRAIAATAGIAVELVGCGFAEMVAWEHPECHPPGTGRFRLVAAIETGGS